jgi:hypothetical protein
MSGCPPKLADAEFAWPLAPELVCLQQSCTRLLVVVDVADPGLTPGGDAGAPLYVEETARLRRTGVRWHERAGLGLAPGSGCLQARAGQGHGERYREQQWGGYDSTVRCHGVLSSLARRIPRFRVRIRFRGKGVGRRLR